MTPTALIHRLAALDAERDRVRRALAEAQWRKIRNGETMMTQIERAVSALLDIDPALAAYVRETYDALDEVVNFYMPKEGSGCDIRMVDNCLVRSAAVLCDLSLKPCA